MRCVPHVAQNAYDTGKARRRSKIDGRTTRHGGYAVSQRIRKRIEEGFGWVKEIAGLAQVKLRGLARVDCAFVLGLAAERAPHIVREIQDAGHEVQSHGYGHSLRLPAGQLAGKMIQPMP